MKHCGPIYSETTRDGLYAFAWKQCEKTGRSLDVLVSKGTDPGLYSF